MKNAISLEPDIEVELGLTLDPEDEYSAILAFRGEVLSYGYDEYGERDEKGTVIGSVAGELIDASDPEFLIQADDISASLHEAVAAVCDPQEGVRDDLADAFWDTVLHIGEVVVGQPYRGKKYGHLIVKTIVDRLGKRCSLAVLKPAPIGTLASKCDPLTEDRQAACHKLASYWAGLGFEPVPDNNDIYYLDLSAGVPWS